MFVVSERGFRRRVAWLCPRHVWVGHRPGAAAGLVFVAVHTGQRASTGRRRFTAPTSARAAGSVPAAVVDQPLEGRRVGLQGVVSDRHDGCRGGTRPCPSLLKVCQRARLHRDAAVREPCGLMAESEAGQAAEEEDVSLDTEPPTEDTAEEVTILTYSLVTGGDWRGGTGGTPELRRSPSGTLAVSSLPPLLPPFTSSASPCLRGALALCLCLPDGTGLRPPGVKLPCVRMFYGKLASRVFGKEDNVPGALVTSRERSSMAAPAPWALLLSGLAVMCRHWPPHFCMSALLGMAHQRPVALWAEGRPCSEADLQAGAGACAAPRQEAATSAGLAVLRDFLKRKIQEKGYVRRTHIVLKKCGGRTAGGTNSEPRHAAGTVVPCALLIRRTVRSALWLFSLSVGYGHLVLMHLLLQALGLLQPGRREPLWRIGQAQSFHEQALGLTQRADWS
ncbi:hypothetical protein TREES_T100014073 [Tupaia chinensis]|uniref:Uncharacterized protein n=1 Tax=Tupaia chinensis TaxID=246437 RepID=L9KKM5_TUPCH|nr:hypothetical protein TREES_T100014073 [Tupaia chinensis]